MKSKCLSLILLGTASCSLSQVYQDLDTELSPQGEIYLSSMSVVAGGESWVGHSVLSLVPQPSLNPVGKIEVNTSRYHMISTAMPFVLTLGIFPGGVSGWIEQSLVVDNGGEEQEISTLVQTATCAGWINCVLWISPNWSFEELPSEEELVKRAFITAINDLAEQ